MDENKTNKNMLEKAKTHKREILIGVGAVAGLAIGFIAGSTYVPKNTVKFSIPDKDVVKSYSKFFGAHNYVDGACIAIDASKQGLQEYFTKAMEASSDEYLYGMILERYSKKK